MKICIIIGAFLPVPPVKGGAVEKMWHRLAVEFVTLGHEVLMISKEHDNFPTNEIIGGVRFLRVPGFETPRGSLQLKLLDLLYARRACKSIPKDIDVIVTNSFWAPIIIKGKEKAKVYVDVARMPKGQMHFYRKAGRLRANSSAVANAIKSELPLALHGLVHTIPNPLPFDADGLECSKDRRPGMLYVGRVHPEKGIHLIILAMRQMQNPLPLRIVGPWKTEDGGDENYYKYLKSISRDLPIEFVGPVFDISALNREYQKASLFLYPSLAEKGETFGLAPLEAMAWGCIPVVSDLACFKDFITHEVNGLVFNHRATDPSSELANCLMTIDLKPDIVCSLSKNSVAVRHTHSSHAIASLFLEDFMKIIMQKKALSP